VKHGTTTGYKNHGCRCDSCRKAWSTHWREYRAVNREVVQAAERKRRAAKQGTVRGDQHGTETGYNYGCRCDLCSEAHTTASRKYKAANREAVNAKGRERYAVYSADPEWRKAINASVREWRVANREAVNAAKRQWSATSVDLMRSLKGTTCVDCGGTFPPEQLHFHHRDPSTKLFILAAAGRHTRAAVRAEAKKCDVLCKPCHEERHRYSFDERCTCTVCGLVFGGETAFERHRVAGRCRTLEEMKAKGFRMRKDGSAWTC
jgi:hypothetical protein